MLWEINSRFCTKTQWQMFLLVSCCHIGAHLGGHQLGGSIQISIKLGKTFLRISSIRKIAVTWILARVFAYIPSFYFQILDLIYWTVLIFYFDLFWMAWHWKPAIGKKKPEKNQGFNGIRTRDLGDTGAMLYQLSYEATPWERGQFIILVTIRAIWNNWSS